MSHALQLMNDVSEEAAKYGSLQGIAAPLPPPSVTALEPARLYLRYSSPEESAAAKAVFDGRTFDGNTVSARFVQEVAFVHAQAGIWDAGSEALGLAPQSGALPGPPPGPPAMDGTPVAYPGPPPGPPGLGGTMLYGQG